MHSSLMVGVDALRANPLRTLLSTLGVVMGVGAMVSVLALGDGVERFAREEIERTTDLLSVVVAPTTNTSVDGILVRRDDVIQFSAADVASLADAVPGATGLGLGTSGAAMLTPAPGAPPRGLMVRALLATEFDASRATVAGGRWFTDADTAVIVLSRRAAGVVAGDSLRPLEALGRSVLLQGNPHRVIGVLAPRDSAAERALEGYTPVTDVARALGPRAVPQLSVKAADILAVDSLRAATERWAAARYGPAWKERLTVVNRRDRVAQTATAMRVFKLLMAAVTGVSLLVGGVGIMNVLLASVAERTREIGIRKAMGARHRDILVQFLAESVAITGFGAAIGVVVGLGIAFLAAAIMRAQTGAPVQAAVTLPTVGFAVAVSVLIGLAFGLYPARRAARLSPIDAIRHD
jgi:putative ABC transport system permease protein